MINSQERVLWDMGRQYHKIKKYTRDILQGRMSLSAHLSAGKQSDFIRSKCKACFHYGLEYLLKGQFFMPMFTHTSPPLYLSDCWHYNVIERKRHV